MQFHEDELAGVKPLQKDRESIGFERQVSVLDMFRVFGFVLKEGAVSDEGIVVDDEWYFLRSDEHSGVSGEVEPVMLAGQVRANLNGYYLLRFDGGSSDGDMVNCLQSRLSGERIL
jgi:hypothetical protein